MQDTAFLITGDFNKLDFSHLEIRHGLSQLVQSATRRNTILDVFCTNRPDMFRVNVMTS